MPLKTHLKEHPNVVVVSEEQRITKTIESLYNENKVPVDFANFANLDIQGAELLALQGMGDRILEHLDYIYTEVNEKELYENCALLPDLDAFLKKKGFDRRMIRMTPHGWGDALYVRKALQKLI